MDYDTWLSRNPADDYMDDDRCQFCGNPVPDGKKFCNNNCKKGYEND